MTSARSQSYVRVHLTLLALLGTAFVLALGCGGSSPAAGTSGSGGASGGTTGTAGTTATGRGGSGSGGSMSTGTGGTTGSAGTTGVAGATGSGGTTGAGGSGTDGGFDGPTLGVDGGGKIPIGSTQCSDGIDNDGDNKPDYLDPECVGPLDNDESSFATGIPGDNMDACKQDCFFDGNSGMGDDHCDWQLKCDPKSTNVKCPYDQTYATQHTSECSLSGSQPQACIDFCRRLVPNGCDCFGCCAIPNGPTILLAATCTAADFGNPAKCPPCTQVTQCSNPCDRCEICIGKSAADLPADCTTTTTDGGTATDGGTPPPNRCGSDFPINCGPGTSVAATACPAPLGCITGCCVPLE